jgi:succinylarginine dihydrolase
MEESFQVVLSNGSRPEGTTMKKLVVFTAFALVGFTAQAAACELDRQASSTEPVVVANAATQTPSTPQDARACEGDRCTRSAEPSPQQAIKTETPTIH